MDNFGFGSLLFRLGVVASNTADDSSLYVLSNIMLMKYNITANTWSTAGLVNVPDSSAGSLVRAGGYNVYLWKRS